jgi:hypothetical protein
MTPAFYWLVICESLFDMVPMDVLHACQFLDIIHLCLKHDFWRTGTDYFMNNKQDKDLCLLELWC